LIDIMELVAATTGIVEILDDVRLLPRAQFDELVNQLLPRCDDWQILGCELVYRGWLTPFQMKRLLRGRGRELVLGSYVLLEPIGEGGMGRVYRCRNWKMGTPAAVKVIRRKQADEPAAVERFLREVRALGAIHHPHVVHALDADLEDGRLYFAMEYVPGTDLGRLLHERGALAIETACRYAAQLAQGLWHISSLGLVHRDVKPGNVLVTEDGSTVKLVDLGLARFDHPDWEAAASDLTQVGMMIGTPDYVAPEQIRDSRRADIRSDLYSLGCTFYHMLAGIAPFAGPDAVAKMYLHQTAEPIRIEQIRPDVPPAVAAMVRKLMAKKPRDRYQDPGEVAATLRPYLLSSGDTLNDAAAPTSPGLPSSSPEWDLPRTDEIPVDRMPLVTDVTARFVCTAFTWRAWTLFWLNRLHWLIAALIAGIAMGFVIGRG
jgi:eukaryotic-like serine/threonine-protein kinase